MPYRYIPLLNADVDTKLNDIVNKIVTDSNAHFEETKRDIIEMLMELDVPYDAKDNTIHFELGTMSHNVTLFRGTVGMDMTLGETTSRINGAEVREPFKYVRAMVTNYRIQRNLLYR